MSSNPEILENNWGSIKVRVDDEMVVSHRDCKLFPGGSMEWDWKLTNLHHQPGIGIVDLDDVKPYIDASTIILLSKGRCEKLGITNELVEYLKNNGHEYLILKTENLIDVYNQFRSSGRSIVALIHTTC